MVTETDEIAEALDDAALAWPELRGDRGALLRKQVVHRSMSTGKGTP